MMDMEATGPAALLLAEWAGPYGGVPPLDRVDVAGFAPALDAAMTLYLAEIDAIAQDAAPPDFANTLAALERSGRALDRVRAVFGIWASTMSSPEVQAVEREMAPRLAALGDVVVQNTALFRRIEAVYENRDTLDDEQQRLAWLYYTNFVRAGARLDAEAKARLSAINQELARLFTRFSQNLLADEESQRLVLEHEDDLAGLPAALRDVAATDAEAHGLPGRWVISNTRSSMEPFLTHSERRDLRERAWRMFMSRGDTGSNTDNKSLITTILTLRAERATLLGFETHAHWRLENSMAQTPGRALQLLDEVWPAAVARVNEEVAEMEELARAAGDTEPVEAWDYRYWAEKVRAERYRIDRGELEPYLQLDRLRDGMFWVARELFGLVFEPAPDVPVNHPDVHVWAVHDQDSGDHVGLWYFDPYARAGKRSGAWMNAYRSQERFDGAITTIVSNNSNFLKPRAGEALLISWDDATTLFHEFGHAIHGLLSSVEYPSLAGTAVPRDYVEFPSQLLEHWLSTPEVLTRFAVHCETGEPLPDALSDRIRRAATFNQGFATAEYLASAIVDMRLHTSHEHDIDPVLFEARTLASLGTPRQVVSRHRTPHFQHVFGSDGYSAAYYSYLWADVLVADAYEAFMEASGPFDAGVAQRLRRYVLSAGNTRDAAEAYRAFRGRDPEVSALLRKRGLAG
jgi:peptidyl-dipeptidase Dcp